MVYPPDGGQPRRLQPGAALGLQLMTQRLRAPCDVRTDPNFEAHLAALSWEQYEQQLGAWAAERVSRAGLLHPAKREGWLAASRPMRCSGAWLPGSASARGISLAGPRSRAFVTVVCVAPAARGAQVLQLVPGLQFSTEARLRAAVARGTHVHRQAGQALFTEGDGADSVLLLVKGQVVARSD